MSSRAMKKLLRDSNGPSPLKEEIITPKGTNQDHEDDHEEEEEEEQDYVVKRPPARNLFALLNGDDDEEEDKDSDNEEKEEVTVTPSPKASKKSKKKKKSKAASGTANPFDVLKEEKDPAPETTSSPPPPAAATAGSKTKSSKNKKKKGKAKTMEEMSVEEFEKSLQQMNQQLGTLSDAGSSSKPVAPLKQLLAVDTRFLDADAEMKKMFGARVVNSEIKDRRYAKITKKALLAQPRGTWPVRKASGLSMEIVDTDRENVMTFKIAHSDSYQRTQLKFLGAVASYDPNNLVALLRESPFHIDTLLQLSEVSKHNGDNSLAGEFIASGSVRLSFMEVENRSFFLAIHRHIQFLGRRGCWRTAFEFNRLLLSLDPVHDELGALLSIDFYALKAQEYNYLKRLYERLQDDHGLDQQPNFAYSIAMAQFHLETAEGKDHTESSKLLQRAIVLFPTAVPLLADQGGFSVESEMAYEAAFFPSADLPKVLDLYIHLFVSRNFALWKEPEVITWLKSNIQTCVQTRFNNNNDPVVQEASKLLKELASGGKQTSTSTLSYSADGQLESLSDNPYPSTQDPRNVSLRVCRHVLVSDFNSLARYLPQEIVTATMHMHDPLPPAGSRNVYEERYEAQRGGLMGGARDAAQTVLEEVVRRLIPGAGGAGGAAGLREDQLRQVAEAVQMLQARIAAGPTEGGLPGAFPGAEGAAVEAESGEAEETALNTAEGQSVFRSLTDMMQLLGFGGRAANAAAGPAAAVGEGEEGAAHTFTQEETNELVAAMANTLALQERGDDDSGDDDEDYDYEDGEEGPYNEEDDDWEPYDPAAYQ
ncbi:Transcription factor 25 [Podila epicladia]|nr:Transcription factor 25 [Podila epicladia]